MVATGGGRVHYLDAMRGVLMLLGVLLHSAQIYNPQRTWLIRSPQSSDVARGIVEGVSRFRMPAFFLVSGYFCWIGLRKYDLASFVRIRLARIVIPLLTVGLTVNLLQAFVLDQSGWRAFTLHSFFGGGRWISHLWFLVNLSVYFAMAIGAYWLSGRTLSKFARARALAWPSRVPMVLLPFVLPLANLLAALVFRPLRFIDARSFGIIDTQELATYLPYFVFGIVMSASERFATEILNPRHVWAAVALLLAFAGASAAMANHGDLGWRVLRRYCSDASSWMAISLCLLLFARFASRANPLLSYLSRASYTIYLFHQLFVVVAGVALVHFAVPALPGIPVAVGITSTLCLAIYAGFIKRYAWAATLFNGVLPVGVGREARTSPREHRRLGSSRSLAAEMQRRATHRGEEIGAHQGL